MEWCLIDPAHPPVWTQPPFFLASPHVPPEGQRGHADRIRMVARLVAELVEILQPASITDLGCGDGSLLRALWGLPVPSWGYDLSAANLQVARSNGVDARRGDILHPETLDLGPLLVATEVAEHLADPRAWLRSLPGHELVLSSPYDERPELGNVYAHHAWAWDQEGYRQLVTDSGWSVAEQRTCPAGFQTIWARRPAGLDHFAVQTSMREDLPEIRPGPGR